MSIPLDATTRARPGMASRRWLGMVTMVASPGLWASQYLYGPVAGPEHPAAHLLPLLFLVGWACAAVGLRRDRATGRGRGAQILFALQLLLLGLAMLQQVQDLLLPVGERVGVFYGVTDMAWPLSMLVMLVVGVIVARVRVWTGWRRWTPLLCGLDLPTAMAAGALLGRPAMAALFGPWTFLGWLALGWAVSREA
jgi:hypothetical protein